MSSCDSHMQAVLDAEIDGDELMKLLHSEIAQWTWKESGGGGVMRLDKNELVIEQRQWVQHLIDRALTQIRALTMPRPKEIAGYFASTNSAAS